MLKKLFPGSLAILTCTGAAFAELRHDHNGNPYDVESGTTCLGGGEYRHTITASLYNSSDPHVYLRNITCNGDGNGWINVTDYAGASVSIVDDESSGSWDWND